MSVAQPRYRRRILYVGYFSFPEGNPAAYRVLGIAKALRVNGFDVMFAGSEPAGRAEDRGPDDRYRYDGYLYESMAEYRLNPRPMWRRAKDYISSGRKTVDWLRSQDLSDVYAIVSYNALSSLGLRLRRFCRERQIPWVADLTEWYDSPWFWGGRLGPRAWDVEHAMRVLNPCGNIIAISSFLEHFYARRGVHTIRVPTLVDLENGQWPQPTHQPGDSLPLRFVYAGQAGRKDSLDNILAGFCLAKKSGLPVTLHLYGMAREKVASSGRGATRCIGQLGSSLEINGWLPRLADILEVMAAADVALLVKRPCRLVEAQFPTKLAQYMAVGLPVLANLTGDVGEYVRDGQEGLLARSDRPADIAATLARFVERRGELASMSRKSRQRAEEFFDYHCYAERLGEFFSRLRPPR